MTPRTIGILTVVVFILVSPLLSAVAFVEVGIMERAYHWMTH